MNNHLYIVATPIGNLKDITLRAVEILGSVNVIGAEDTRRTQQLLSHLQIGHKKLVSLHEHNEKSASQYLIELLGQGLSVALVSDAGTPLISDPGAILVQEVRKSGFSVVPIPGVSALITLLSVAGLAIPEFTFIGFLPSKSKHRIDQLNIINNINYSTNIIFYEAPHRILETIADFQKVFDASQQITFGRELTKQFETIHQCELSEALNWLESDSNHQRGEFVLIISPKVVDAKEDNEKNIEDEKIEIDFKSWVDLLLEHSDLSVKDIVQLSKSKSSLSKDKIYQYVLEQKNLKSE